MLFSAKILFFQRISRSIGNPDFFSKQRRKKKKLCNVVCPFPASISIFSKFLNIIIKFFVREEQEIIF